ncbi:hypothetical protein AgCh_028042 [Apium graveolens]
MVQSNGECKSVVLKLQNLTIVEDFLPIALGNSDLILGLQWLEMLGTMTANWKSQRIKFKLGNDTVTLIGDSSLGRSGITLKAMLKTLRKEKQGFLVEFNYMGTGGATVAVRRQGDRYPQMQKDEKIEKLIHDMLTASIIQLSRSSFSSPVLLVKRKDGSWRFCVDYRALNKATVPNKFPIPVIDELLDELHRASIFTKLDLKSRYHQVRVRSEDVPKLLFGLTKGITNSCTNEKEHLIHVQTVLDTPQGVAVDPSKVQSVLDWPIPQSIKELRGFLGLTGYYRKFIKNYAHISSPLTEQLKDNFGWNGEATVAFELLKQALISTPVLHMPDFSHPFMLEKDASSYGLGAVLLQNEHPIAYFSKVLGQRARMKSIYEKELMAIVLAVQKWRHYLLGHTFVIRTDQKSLKFLMEQKEVGMDYQCWLSKLMGYHFQIVYKSGVMNKAADALSRLSNEGMGLNNMITGGEVHWQEIEKELQGDNFIQQLKDDLTKGKTCPGGYELIKGMVQY